MTAPVVNAIMEERGEMMSRFTLSAYAFLAILAATGIYELVRLVLG